MNSHESKVSFIIVDDDKDDQLLLLEAFTENAVAYESVSVYNGRELMDYLLFRRSYEGVRHAYPDFIFLDINMPVQNGFETLREIKANKILKNIPVYIFSTSCSSKEQAIAIGLGAARCYTKPTDFHEIKKLVNEVVALS